MGKCQAQLVWLEYTLFGHRAESDGSSGHLTEHLEMPEGQHFEFQHDDFAMHVGRESLRRCGFSDHSLTS